MDTPQVLLEHYLKQLRLPTMVREYRKLGEQCAKEGVTFEVFLLRLVESEMMDRERRATERRSRSIISDSTSRRRNTSKVEPSLAHCSPNFRYSRTIVGNRSCFR